jgi:hypothetical protein
MIAAHTDRVCERQEATRARQKLQTRNGRKPKLLMFLINHPILLSTLSKNPCGIERNGFDGAKSSEILDKPGMQHGVDRFSGVRIRGNRSFR